MRDVKEIVVRQQSRLPNELLQHRKSQSAITQASVSTVLSDALMCLSENDVVKH
jgi:hypothetical protein